MAESEQQPDVYTRRARRLLSSGGAEEKLADALRRTASAEDELRTLRRLATVGLATEILGHQFESSSQHIRDCLGRFPEEIKSSSYYKWLKSNFDELYDRIHFMIPLRVHRYHDCQLITGKSIQQYLESFYGGHIRNRVFDLAVSDRFRDFSIHQDPSTVLPIFVAIINNAAYWVRQSESQGSAVFLDMPQPNTVIVSDNGPGVHENMVPRLFKALETGRARGGSGIGLYLCRVHMESMGGTIEYVHNHPSGLEGATFVLTFPSPRM